MRKSDELPLAPRPPVRPSEIFAQIEPVTSVSDAEDDAHVDRDVALEVVRSARRFQRSRSAFHAPQPKHA